MFHCVKQRKIYQRRAVRIKAQLFRDAELVHKEKRVFQVCTRNKGDK
jgi:hypothetical protein